MDCMKVQLRDDIGGIDTSLDEVKSALRCRCGIGEQRSDAHRIFATNTLLYSVTQSEWIYPRLGNG